MSERCAVCKTTETRCWHAWDDNPICDDCASIHGCLCGCFPPPMKIAMAKLTGLVGYWEKDENDKWQFIQEE